MAISDCHNIRIIESECCSRLTQRNLSGYFADVTIEGTTDIIKVAEYKGPVGLETDSNNVFRVLFREFVCLFHFKLVLEQKFFVV